jgi:V/A-type H+-transporting ATPase subunit D
MAIRFQYNKTSLQHLRKQLKMREGALPVLKNKESALRLEVQRCRAERDAARRRRESVEAEGEHLHPLLARFGFGRLRPARLRLGARRVAGVSVPVYEGVDWRFDPLPEHAHPIWTADAVAHAEAVVEARLAERVAERQLAVLERERKRTTQKVNLYEKVQIPELETGIKKIKRFLEDKENLAKAAQKMVKARLETPPAGRPSAEGHEPATATPQTPAP